MKCRLLNYVGEVIAEREVQAGSMNLLPQRIEENGKVYQQANAQHIGMSGYLTDYRDFSDIHMAL